MHGLIIAEWMNASNSYAALRTAYSLVEGNSLGSNSAGLVISHPRHANQMARGIGLAAVL
jgi:hypothetical protein